MKKLLSAFALAGALVTTAARAHYLHPFAGIIYGTANGITTTGFVKHYYPGNSVVRLDELVLPSPDTAHLALVGVRVEARANEGGGPEISVLVGGHLTSVPQTVQVSGTGPYFFPGVLKTASGPFVLTGSTLALGALKVVGDVWIDRVTLIWGPALAPGAAVGDSDQQGLPIQQ